MFAVIKSRYHIENKCVSGNVNVSGKFHSNRNI